MFPNSALTIPINVPGYNIGRRFSNSASTADLQKAILEHVEQVDMNKAEEALKLLERDSPESMELDTYTAVLNGWVQHLEQVEDGPHQVNQQFQAANRANAILERLQRKHETGKEDAVFLRPIQQHYDAVLNAWLLVTRSMLELDTPLRGIPQRAQSSLGGTATPGET